MQTFMIGEGTSIVGGAYWFKPCTFPDRVGGQAMRDCVGRLDIRENCKCRLGSGRLLPFIILRWRLLGAELIGDRWWVPIQNWKELNPLANPYCETLEYQHLL